MPFLFHFLPAQAPNQPVPANANDLRFHVPASSACNERPATVTAGRVLGTWIGLWHAEECRTTSERLGGLGQHLRNPILNTKMVGGPGFETGASRSRTVPAAKPRQP